MVKKGYNYSIKKKITLILLLNLFGIFIISQFLRFVNIFREFLSNCLWEDRKSLPCVKGGGTACRDDGIVKAKFYEKQSLSRPTGTPTASAPFAQGSLS